MEHNNMEKVIQTFEEMSKNAENVQSNFLRKVLEVEGSTEYLRILNLNGRTDPESFKACVPIATHKDFEPYIQKISEGDFSPILTTTPFLALSLSTGTTDGKRKFLPFHDVSMKTTIEVFRTSFAFRNRKYPIDEGKALQFIYGSEGFKTKGGLLAGTASAHVYTHPDFQTGMKELLSQSCTPTQVIRSSNYHQSLYCHLLCGLIFRDQLQVVFSTFAHSLVQALQTLEQVWEQLCTDIQYGVLSSRIITDPIIREAMSHVLVKPNPELADLIRTKISSLSNWYGVIPQLFPNVKYVLAIMTGSMEPYVKSLRHYAGNLRLISHDYGASEGWIGINIEPELGPELVTFCVLPNIGYYEFIPVNRNINDDGNKTLGLTEVNVGEEYEVVITNGAGLYRYKLGDVVKVTGFHNSIPKLKFVRRSNVILSINLDKNTEYDLQHSVEEAAKILANQNLDIIDFTSYGDLSTTPGHYVIYWEMKGEASDVTLQECCDCLDYSFADSGYENQRKVNAIGALELRLLRTGTFEKVLDYHIQTGGSVNQFKLPRCINRQHKFSGILSDNVVKSYFSNAY